MAARIVRDPDGVAEPSRRWKDQPKPPYPPGMSSRFDRFLIGLDRLGRARGEEDPLRRRLLVALTIVSIPIGLGWATTYAFFGNPLAGLFPLIVGVVSAVNLVLFRRTGDYGGVRFRQLVMFLVLPLGVMLALGSFEASSAVIIWSFVAPIGGIVFDTPRRALGWFVADVVILAVAALVAPLLDAPEPLPPAVVAAFFVLNIAALSAVTFGVLILFASQREAAIRLAAQEHEKSEDLLRNILPVSIAEALKGQGRRIADQFDGVTILFADVVGFTPIAAQLEPARVVELLDRLFTEFDALVERAGVEKIKTIGDAYMVAAGVPEPRADHAVAIARLALEMLAVADQAPEPPLELRIGINSGSVVAGVIGRKRLIYDLWGDAVNVASRMESQGAPGRIQLTRSTHDLIEAEFICEPHGTVNVKGRGELETWFLVGARRETLANPAAPAG